MEEHPPGKTLENSGLEAQKSELYGIVERKDKELGGKFVLRIPTESRSEVLIFPASCTTIDGKSHPKISHAGLHPHLGPIAILNGTTLSTVLQEMIDNGEQDVTFRSANWEGLFPQTEETEEQFTTDLRADQDTWKRAYDTSKAYAELEFQTAVAQQQVVRDLLDHVKTSESPTPTRTNTSTPEND